jgi:ribulose-phosphate 3-epimerase
MPKPWTHLLEVEMRLQVPNNQNVPNQTNLIMPVWTPGSYLIREFERHVQDFAAAGANNITVHYEATPHVHKAVQAIKESGCTAGVALTPSTPVEALSEVRGELWSVLCMTVNPGWGGQQFIPASLDKIRRLRALVGPDVELEVDGGIDEHTAGPCAEAGATLFVAGTSVFGTEDPGAAFRRVAVAAGCS